MSTETSQEALLEKVLERVNESNLAARPGTPMAELRAAIEDALSNLEPLDFEDFTDVLDEEDAAATLVNKAPELIGWNADKIVEWFEELGKKLEK